MCQENSSFVEIEKIWCTVHEDLSALVTRIAEFFAKCEKVQIKPSVFRF